jgi:hypothetical protein
MLFSFLVFYISFDLLRLMLDVVDSSLTSKVRDGMMGHLKIILEDTRYILMSQSKRILWTPKAHSDGKRDCFYVFLLTHSAKA